MVCGSRIWCVEVVHGVLQSYMVCGSRTWCVEFLGCVRKVWQIPKIDVFMTVSGQSEHVLLSIMREGITRQCVCVCGGGGNWTL